MLCGAVRCGAAAALRRPIAIALSKMYTHPNVCSAASARRADKKVETQCENYFPRLGRIGGRGGVAEMLANARRCSPLRKFDWGFNHLTDKYAVLCMLAGGRTAGRSAERIGWRRLRRGPIKSGGALGALFPSRSAAERGRGRQAHPQPNTIQILAAIFPAERNLFTACIRRCGRGMGMTGE